MLHAPEHNPKSAPNTAPFTRFVVVATRTSKSLSAGVSARRGSGAVSAVARGGGGGWK